MLTKDPKNESDNAPSPVLLDIPTTAGARLSRLVNGVLAGPQLLGSLEKCLCRRLICGGSSHQRAPFVARHADMPWDLAQEAGLAAAGGAFDNGLSEAIFVDLPTATTSRTLEKLITVSECD